MNIEAQVYSKTGQNIIGAEVIVYNDVGDKVDSIQIVNETQLQELKNDLDKLDSTYIRFADGSILEGREIDELLANVDEDVVINAVTLSGFASDDFSKSGHLHDDRYFTESEVTSKLASKANKSDVNLLSNQLDELDSNKLNISDFIFKKVYELPVADFSSNLQKDKGHSLIFWKAGNLVLCRYYLSTNKFTSGVVGSERDVAFKIPQFLCPSSRIYEFTRNMGGSPCELILDVNNMVKLRPHSAEVYVIAGQFFYIVGNTDLE